MADEFFPLWHLPNLEFFNWTEKTKSHRSGCKNRAMKVDPNIWRWMVNSRLLKTHCWWSLENKGKEFFLCVSASSCRHARKYFHKWFLTFSVSNSVQVPRPGFDTEVPEWTGRDSPTTDMFYPLEKERNHFFPPFASYETSMSRQPCLNMSIQGALQLTLHESMQTNRWLTELTPSDTVSLPALLLQCAWTWGQVWICLLWPWQRVAPKDWWC